MNENIVRKIIYILFVVLNFLAVYAGVKPQSTQPVRLLQSSDEEIVVEYIPMSFVERIINVEGRQMKIIEAPLAGWTMEAGKPQLPTTSFLIALPPGKNPSVEVIESKFDVIEQQEVAPAPTYQYTEEGEAVPEYYLDKNFYETHNVFYPSRTVELSDIAPLRDVQTAKITLYPLQYNPTAKQLKKITHLKIRIRFTADLQKQSRQWQAISGSDPLFNSVYNSLLVNAHQVGAWRGVDVEKLQSVLDDTTDDWYSLGQTYYRIPIIKDGIYRLTYNDLLSYGIDLTAISNATLALYYKGNSQPLRVEVSDPNPVNWFIEFYAQRNYGVNSYFDRYNDTSKYFLTWNDSNPKRYSTFSITPSMPTDTLKWCQERFYAEQDAKYFSGVTLDDIQTTDDVPGEGWYWNDFSSGTSRNFTFTIDSVQRGTGAEFKIRVRLHGMTLCQSVSCRAPSRHRATFRLNGTIIDSIDWIDNTEIIFERTFPESRLRTGLNTLNVRSKAWSSSDSNITKFYLDWFEITYSRPLQVNGASLKFVNQAPSSFDTLTFVVTGISADSATVYDLTGKRRISGLVSLGAQKFAFSDTVSGVKEYFVVRDSGKMLPSTVQIKTFRNLRTNTTGADYIVITHSLFKNEANQLAQFRAATDKVRTSVIDVQDIYDEFNFGHVHPEAIRSMLKHAYYYWRKPSPAIVVMFGDASWDPKKNLSTTIKVDYLPSFGSPPSDNAFVSFDSARNYLPYMIIGRIPVESAVQAAQVLSKIMGYEQPPRGEWNKKFLFITGGSTAIEQFVFNGWSDDLLNRYVTASPIGGTADKVYKSSTAIIDGEYRPYLQQTINEGVVFVNFIGHSGGRIWNVDIGKPSELQNTGGQLPFVSSVSCNVGAFHTHFANVLAEDFLVAENRGAIATWAASSIGYGSVGRTLVDKFLSLVTRDYSRDLGTLTTISRLHFWITSGSATPLVIQTLHLHPLIGDPLTKIAIPVLSDFEVNVDDVVLKNAIPTSDSTVTLAVTVRNVGLMAGVPIKIALRDSYTDEQGKYQGESDLVPPFYIDDFIGVDSFNVSWNVKGKPGSHTVIVTIDPNDSIPELSNANNTTQKTFYIYRNQLLSVRPLKSSVISSTPTLVVTVPAGRDTTPLTYTFEIDTSYDFSSPSKIVSPTIIPGKVSASWTPPALNSNTAYYWRGRNSDGTHDGAWAGSSFFLSSSVPGSDTVQWRQTALGQFYQNSLSQALVTNAGITMAKGDSNILYARSLGSRAYPDSDYYSIVQVNTVKAVGLWWENCWSYLGGSYNPATGEYQLKGFDLLKVGYTDSLQNFLQGIPNGYYVMLSVVRDGKQNMTETLYQLFEQLGATQIRSVTSGQSWCMISRKGDGVALVESYQPTGVAVATVALENFYNNGEALVLSEIVGPAQSWYKASWDITGINATTFASVLLLGLRTNGMTDTVMYLPVNTATEADISSINAIQYPRLQLLGKLSNADGFSTPLLRRWGISYSPVADLAISAWTYRAFPETVQTSSMVNVSLDVYNIGYKYADSIRVAFFLAEDTTQRADTLIPSLAIDGQQHIQTQLRVNGFGAKILVARVNPKSGVYDLLEENNTASVPIFITGSAEVAKNIRILLDGVEIRDGDYVSPTPSIDVEYKGELASSTKAQPFFDILLDGKPLYHQEQTTQKNVTRIQTMVREDSLADGSHTIEVTYKSMNRVHTLKKVSFQVLAATRLLQVHNYPNPFSGETYFTFVVTGSRVPDEVQIKVFTVAGRMVKEIVLNRSQLNIGFNRVLWDGRDNEGDEIANGYYFYKVIMTSDGSQTAEVVEKLARLR